MLEPQSSSPSSSPQAFPVSSLVAVLAFFPPPPKSSKISQSLLALVLLVAEMIGLAPVLDKIDLGLVLVLSTDVGPALDLRTGALLAAVDEKEEVLSFLSPFLVPNDNATVVLSSSSCLLLSASKSSKKSSLQSDLLPAFEEEDAVFGFVAANTENELLLPPVEGVEACEGVGLVGAAVVLVFVVLALVLGTGPAEGTFWSPTSLDLTELMAQLPNDPKTAEVFSNS